MAKAKKASKSPREDNSGLDIEFADGTTLSLDVTELSPDMQARAMVHGISQKIGDSYSGADSIEEAVEAAKGTIEQLRAGDWTIRREGGAPRITALVEALASVTGESMDKCTEVISAMEDAEKKGLRKHPQIAAELARISAMRAAEKAAKAAEAAEGAENIALPL